VSERAADKATLIEHWQWIIHAALSKEVVAGFKQNWVLHLTHG
jgi:hypothetical protein